MSTLTQDLPRAGEQYRFIVTSADEAVRVLHERLGGNARVVSVRQVEGAGLARFLRAPKLEVIAEVLAAPGPAELVETDLGSPIDNVEPAAEEEAVIEEALRAVKVEELPTIPPPEPRPGEDLSRLLLRGALPPVMLAAIQSSPKWSRISALPLHAALNEVALLLRDQYLARPERPLRQRVAFLGAAGSGKTTALCKWLATDVFVRRRSAAVLKVDLDRANPGDGLAVFCEALGVPLSRSAEDLPTLLPNEKTYVDLPGMALNDDEEIALYSEALRELSVTSRVLVINAAYETAVIRQIYEAGARLGATHVVFTHLDELGQWGKLWEFVLGHDPAPLFLSSGRSIAGDFVEEVFPSILARTFPDPGPGSEIAKSTGGL